jgi:hypothetical protein
MSFHLVLIETSGNQNYIFSTNRLRENVGASELTYRVGTQWTLEAVENQCGRKLWPEDGDSEQLRKNLLDQGLNPPIDQPEGLPVEVILATSGKALLLVKGREAGKKIVSRVTEKALKLAPGIDVCGVISEGFEWNQCQIGNLIRRVHGQFEETKARVPGPALRFQRLPVVAECASSGLPAREWHKPAKEDGMEEAPRSAVTLAKWDYRADYEDRMNRLLNRDKSRLDFSKNIGELEKLTDWIAIVHADGNGLGQIFLDFGKYAGCTDTREYLEQLKRFSLGLDLCTERAFKKALDHWVAKAPEVWYKLPLLPIVLGGDDVTVVCDGRAAIPFSVTFLNEFESETGRTTGHSADDQALYDIIQKVATQALGTGRLSISAGISVVKPHYPFSGAYQLAEDLIQSAKQIKKVLKNPANGNPWPASSIDFHIHYDTSGNDLDEIRRRLVSPDGKARLYGRPYVVSDLPLLLGEIETWPRGREVATEWIKQHHWDRLQTMVAEMNKTDQDQRRKLPSSQLHELRSGLHVGKNAADARYALIRHRYQDEVEMTVFDGDDEKTLFETRCDGKEEKNGPPYLTRLLDAMELVALENKKIAAVSVAGGADA